MKLPFFHDNKNPQPTTSNASSTESIIIPAKRDHFVKEFMEEASHAANEYLDAARSMKIPIPTPKITNISSPSTIPASPLTIPPPVPITPYQDIIGQTNPTNPTNNFVSPLSGRKLITLEIPTSTAPVNSPQITQKTPESHPTVYVDTQQLTDYGEDFGRIVSSEIDEIKPRVIKFIAYLFHIISFAYATLTLILFSTIIALAIYLTNAGSPGFIYLKYFPTIGLLPILSCLAMIIFMFVAYKIQDGSKISWIIAVMSLLTFPISFAFMMPVMSQPLVKLSTVYAGTTDHPLTPLSLSVNSLNSFYSLFLIFEGILFLLLIFLKNFHFQYRPLTNNAKTSLLVVFAVLFIPITSVMGYGYYKSVDNNFGYTKASNSVGFHIYFPNTPPGGRQIASYFNTNDALGDMYNALKVTYDVPLPTLLQTGLSSPITIKEAKTLDDFNLVNFVNKQDRDVGVPVNTFKLENALNNTGYSTIKGIYHYIWYLTNDNVLINIYSSTASTDELIQFASNME
jgi:hypothetical protein